MFGELTRTQIHDLFQRNARASRITPALELLFWTKKARPVRRDSDGRPTEVWMVI